MKIVFTGGGSGGHFYPIVAIAEKLSDLSLEQKIVDIRLYFLSESPYDKRRLFENAITYVSVPSGKLRRYFSLRTLLVPLETIIGITKALIALWNIYPDVVFGKGGYSSFPTLVAAKLLRIPIMIHESDSVPGKTNVWAGKFADRIALSFKEASSFFPEEKIAYTGQPVRKEILTKATEGAEEYLHLEEGVPTILILGGSLGSQIINNTILEVLPEILKEYQVIHQVGDGNIKEIESTVGVILEKHPEKSRYHPFGTLNDLATKMSAGVASLVISRAGSTIFEIAAWNLPSIIIPITDSNGDHQRKNAYNYARTGACTVIEERNLAPHLLVAEIRKIVSSPDLSEKMRVAAKGFFKPDAARVIAEELVRIGLSHEK